MGYTTFSTDNADYVLQLGDHLTENKQVDIFAGIDALVVETMMGLRSVVEIVASDRQYKLPFRYCADNAIPILKTDVKTTGLGLSRTSLSYYSLFPVHLLNLVSWLHYGLSEKSIDFGFRAKTAANLEYFFQTPIVEGRNAFNARKIEEFVAPLVAERLGRKPYLGLIFGAGHLGLKPDLQSKIRRDFTIWNWRNLNFGKWAGFREEDLNLVEEANHGRDGWVIQTYSKSR